MNESDKTMVSQSTSPVAPESLWQRYQLLFIGAGGAVALVLCMGLLVGVGYFLGSMGDKPESDQTPVAALPPTPPSETASATDIPTATPLPEPTATDSPTATPPPADPEFGAIAFALDVNNDVEPVDPSNTFEAGIAEIHAVFPYNNMSPDHTWERVWYNDGEEMLRNNESWTGDASGQFDYFLDTGGSPLPPGNWTLELYVDGELLTSGSFSIEPQAVTQQPTSTRRPTATSTPTPTSVPVTVAKPVSQRTFQLLYSKWEGNSHNLYVADTNGNGEQLLLTKAAGASWSPDKSRLFLLGEQGVTQQKREGQPGCAFGTISDGVLAIDVMSPLKDICAVQGGDWFCERKQVDLQAEPSDVCTANGISIYQNLDWKVGSARWAAASPDGEAIAFDAKPGGDYRIYFRAMLGTSQQFRFELVGEQGSWSPNSQQMVYRSGRDNKSGIWISNRDDSGHTQITSDGTDSFPSWSADGKTIAFSRKVYGNVDIYTVNPDGSNLTRLTEDSGIDTLPVYTPDGDLIFRSDRTGSWGIWKMNGSGGGQTQIIPNAGMGPDWAYSKMDVK